MEGVPRIPMMGFPMKRSADTPHFRSRLKSFISNHYNEEADSYSNEIHELETLRASAVHVSKDYSGCSTLKKYFCQLNFLKSRFPMNEGGSCAVSFSWYDVFSEHVHGWSDVDFEMSCILYNIGALHSELGALDNRQTAEGMKTSCTHFQCAAWAFNHLRHNYQKFFTPDVSPDMLNILYNICLAQAQECILEKSLIDNRKSTITAKVALQIVEYYSTALRIIDTMSKDAAQYSDKLIKSVKTWRKLVELKVHYYGCVAYLYRGMQSEDQGKWGERVTMYKAAVEKLNTCIKLGKNLEKTDPIHDTLHFTLDVVGGKVAIAEKENEFIYHEKVPELEAVMSDVKGVSLVKGIQFKFDDIQVAGPDIFGRLVPMEAHEASSLYSEEKAKILRTYSKKIEEKNESLDRFVLPLQLDHLELHDAEKIPQELIDCCAALSVNQDAVKRLSELMSRLSSLFHDVEANLEEIQDHLADQEKRETEYQVVVGKRPPNNILNEISREFQKYQSAQAVAAESNKTLHEAMVAHVANLTVLMKPLDDVMKHIPNYDEMEKNEEALERMKKLSGKVGEMRKQREMLESQLRDSILNDDITKSLVVKKDEDLETVFKEELQKHDKVTQLLDQNLLAQENIVRALTEANAEYAETRKATVELKRKRDTVIQSYISSYEAYDELISKCNKGIEFYTKLNTNVEKLLQRIRSVCKVQNEERDINMERIIRKAQAPIPPVTPATTLAYNNMLPGQYPSYSAASSVSPSSIGGYSAMPATAVPVSPAGLPPSRGSGGGHLKLKDYLAMKKEGQNPSAMLQNNMASAMNTPTPQHQAPTAPAPAGYDPAIGQQMQQHPMMSSTPPPVNPSMGVRPAPVGSEDVGGLKSKDTSNYPYPQHQQQPAYNNYGYYPPGPPGQVPNPATSGQYPNANASTAYYNQQSYNAGNNQTNNQATAPTAPSASPASGYYQGQQGPTPPSQQQVNSSMPSQNPRQPSPHPPQQYPVPAPTPPSNQQASSYSTPPHQQQQLQHQISPNPALAMMTSYTPNQPGYSPISTMNTSMYSSPVYSSRHHPYAGGGKEHTRMDMGNTYSSSYGIPLSYSGPSGYQQTINSTCATSVPPAQYPTPAGPIPSPAIAPPAAQQQQTPSSFYSPIYHPTANTITNATYSTGTTATPSQIPPPSQPSPAPVPVQQAPQVSTQIQPPSQVVPRQESSNVAPTVPTPPQQQQQQQPPATAPSNMDTYSPANSFLAQYVRQNQGYISSSGAQPPVNNSTGATFPSSVNYGDNIATYPQPPQQQQQQVGYPPQQTPYQPTQQQPTGYGQQQQPNQYPGYGQQQQWQQQQPTHQVPQQQQPQSSQQQQQQGGYSTNYQQPQPQQPSYPNQQQGYQQYGNNAPQAQQQAPQGGYYNAAPPQQNNSFQQPPQQHQQAPAPNKAVRSSNLDLLSDIDFNALPTVAPLAPVAAGSSESNQETSSSTSSSTPNHSSTTASASSSLPTTALPSPSHHPPKPASSSSAVTHNSVVAPTVPTTTSLPFIPSSSSSNGTSSDSNNLLNGKSSSVDSNADIISKVKVERKSKESNDPFKDPETLEQFVSQVEQLETEVEGLMGKKLESAPETVLDLKWKDLLKIQNATSVQRSISVARCYLSKNRFPDILPYDQTRVPIQIQNTNDDYINASFVNNLGTTLYPFIAAQAPLLDTRDDFWQMIWEYKVELVACLCSDVDLKESVYWPKDKGPDGAIEHRSLKIVLQTRNVTAHFVERTMTVTNRELKQNRVVVHLQFTGWPGHAFPPSPSPLVSFVKEVSSYYLQQRSLKNPVLVHCIPGVGKTGVFCVLAAAMQDIDNGYGVPDVTQIAGKASEQRKGIMNDKEYLRYTYQALLGYCQDILSKRGVCTTKPLTKTTKKSHVRHSSQDFLKEISLDKLLVGHNISKSATTFTSTSNGGSPSSSRTTTPRHYRSCSLADASSAAGKPRLNYADVPDTLTNVDTASFIQAKSLKMESVSVEDLAASRRLAFESNKGALLGGKAKEENTEDPLGSLDPLWTLKK